jgi:oligopeptide transport system substrate-binding protein
MKKLLVLVIALVAVFALAACGGNSNNDEDVVFNWNIGADPRTLDPGLNGASDGGDVINNTFEGLVREKNGEVLPGMAESWEVSADGLTVTFNIREDAKWSDGTPVTADDFVRSWLRGMDPRNASEYSWIWDYTNVEGAPEFVWAETDVDSELDALADAVGIESANDGAQFIVHLIAPTDWFVSLMAFYHFMPVPETATIDGEGAWAKDPATAISNGPFTLSEYTVGDQLVLVKNENYWNAEEVGIDVINGYFIEESTTAYAKYQAGELDFIPSVPSAEIPQLMVASDEFYVFPLLGTYYINFNLSGCDEVGGTRDIGTRDNTIFCNADLREALALSINREEITEALAAGQVPAAGFVSEGFADNNGEDFFANSQDDSNIVTDDGAYAQAVTLFASAAAELFPGEADPVAALQAALEDKEYRFNTSDGHQLVGELIQGMWEENLGFTIQLANEEWALFQATRTDGNYDMARGGWLTDFMDPSGMLGIFTQGNAYNDPDYFNQDFEDAIEASRTATTSEAHFDALYLAHEIFMADMPVIPIYHYNDSMLVKSYVTGWSRSVLGSIDFSTASITTEK